MEGEYLTVTQAAALLGVPPRTVAYRLQRGLMRGAKINSRLWLIPRGEVEAWRSHPPLPRGRRTRS
jgi:excisionase family DNA binding protein